MRRVIKIRKCGVEFPFISKKVVERPDQNKRYNAPHLDSMGICTDCAQPHSYTRNECCSLSLHSENFHIFYSGLAKNTFNMSATPQNSTTKLSKIFRTNNTLAGHCSPTIEKIASRISAKGEKELK